MLAPKNRFQAHRIIDICQNPLVYHVDFLNELAPDNPLELVTGDGAIRSIYTPSMSAIFENENYREHEDYYGVKFPSIETFILTKAAAMESKKRDRDAFDVFVSVFDEEPSAFKAKWRKLVLTNEHFKKANKKIVEAVDEGNAIEKILKIVGVEDAKTEKLVRETFAFLSE